MKFDFAEIFWNVWENPAFQRFLYWVLFVDNPVRVVRQYDQAVDDLLKQVTEKNLEIDGQGVKNDQIRKELMLKNGQVLQLKSDLVHLQAQIIGLESEKENLKEVLDDSERIISDLQARVRDLQADLAEAKEQQVNVQQVEELEGLLRYYQMQCRELQRQVGQESPATQPAQDGGTVPGTCP